MQAKLNTLVRWMRQRTSVYCVSENPRSFLLAHEELQTAINAALEFYLF